MGATLGIMMMFQVLTGILLSIHYIPEPKMAFNSYSLISKNISMGFMLKYFHSTGVSLIFILILVHMFRGMLNQSFKNTTMWYSGVIILLMIMATSFLGYVLPWGQMSLWGATVICSMLSSIPVMGTEMVKWIWGNFSVSQPTLNRFFTFHFTLPFLILMMIMIHLTILHMKGSSNNMNMNSSKDKISFKKKFYFKDMNTILILIMMMNLITTSNPTLLIDPENFNPANPLITPIHIMPEWYFLFAYAMLRTIPNKMGGIMIMIMSIFILFMFKMMKMKNSSKFNPKMKYFNMTKISTYMSLTFLGAKPIEYPFNWMASIMTMMYFVIMLK